MIGVNLGEIRKLRRAELIGADFAVVVGVELLQHLIGVDVDVRRSGEFLVAQLPVVVGVELLELGLEALLDVRVCAVSSSALLHTPS